MNNKLYLRKLSFLYSLLFLMSATLFSSISYAADISVVCSKRNDCTATPKNTPLFSEKRIGPLWSITKTISVKNDYSDSRNFYLVFNNEKNKHKLYNSTISKIIFIEIEDTKVKKKLWSGSLEELFKKEYINLGLLRSKNIMNLKVYASIPNVGNEYQNNKIKFELILGYKSERGDNDFGNEPNVLGYHTIRNIFSNFHDRIIGYYQYIHTKYKH